MISYAQNFEDVMLARLFGVEHHGFYIDIGAAHPEFLSVTCHFYKHGWRGINVEPSQHFYPLLCAARPEDVNLQCAVGREAGRATFYEFLNCAENSTLDRPVADRLVAGGMPAAQHEVEVIPLADLCDMHAKARTIDFMKIDVEGGELAVLEGGNWEKFKIYSFATPFVCRQTSSTT
jgi:FkbM family methyltransferase